MRTLLLILAVAALATWLAAVTRGTASVADSPPIATRGTGPSWAPGEVVTIAATGERVRWLEDYMIYTQETPAP